MDVRYRFKTHALRCLCSERGTQAASTEKYKFLVLSENRFVIGTLRIDPEFQQAARTMKGARDPAIALEFANIADIDKHGIVAARKLDGLFNRQRLDFAFGGLAQGLISDCDVLHGLSPSAAHAGRARLRTQAKRLKRVAQAGTIVRRNDSKPMMAFTAPDLAALAWFVGAWIVYSIVIEKTAKGRTSLNALMNSYRDQWMERLLERDMRMVDAQVTAALQNGTAFFASTSLIAIGGALTLLRSSEDVLTVMSLLPFGAAPSRSLWDLKMMGLIVIFVYAFFKFAWSYRLFNYFAIMVGAAPLPAEKDTAEAQAFAHRASRLCADAGRHFNRGQRAFFFALGYLGWFLGPIPFALSTAGILIVMWRRQFASDARKAFDVGVEYPGASAPTRRLLKPSPSRRRSQPRSALPTTPQPR
jgi:uncharacterized membrane protein